MKNIKGFALGLALGLAAALSTVGFAQDTKLADQNKNAESCCAMQSCCCKGDSCSMNHEAMDPARKGQTTEHSKKDGCCCCGGDSCNMKMNEKQKQG
jgi:hypothetical protein